MGVGLVLGEMSVGGVLVLDVCCVLREGEDSDEESKEGKAIVGMEG